MRISTFFYNLKQGLKNIVRNKMFSLASIATMAACIFLFGIVFAIVVNFRYIVQNAEKNVSVTVFFHDYVEQDEMEEIGGQIKARAEVSSINFVDGDAAWEDFSQEYFEGNEDLISGFEEDNPLKDADHYEVFLEDVSKQEDLVAYIESIEAVRRVNSSQSVADSLSNFNILIGYISVAIILILVAVSVFLISNTVTIGIAVRKEEIGIMKLIGAKDSFVKAPFIVEGVILGIVGSAIPLGALYYIYNQVLVYIQERFNILTNILVFVPVNDVFKILLPTGIGLGVGIGLLGSFLTIRKHLRV